MTIQNFKNFVDEAIMKEGKEYFDKDKVISLEELEKGLQVASVEDTLIYEIKVLLHKNTDFKEITNNYIRKTQY